MVRELLNDAAKKLSNSESPLLDARVLLAKAMNKENAALIFETPDDAQKEVFNTYIDQRAKGVPVAYILGKKEFMGLTFRLNEDTLIPRPDTECLVEKVIEKCTFRSPKIIDLCSGSGCIGISIVKFIDGATCDLTDISENAMKAEKENAKGLLALLREDGRIAFEASNHYFYTERNLLEKIVRMAQFDNAL